MKLTNLSHKTLNRYFRSFDKQGFVQRGQETIKIVQEIKSSNKETMSSKLTLEQKEYVDMIYETYFQYMPNNLHKKFYLYCLNQELKVKSPEELLFNTLVTEPKDLEMIENPVEDFYTITKEFQKLVLESTKNIDMSKLTQQQVQKPTEETAPLEAEVVDQTKKRFKVDVIAIDAAKKLNIIKEVKAMLNIGLKDVN